MRIKRFLAMGIALSMLFVLYGCRNNDDDPNSSQPDVPGENELVIYHNSDEITPYLTSAANAYSQATGKKVSVKLSEGDFMNEITGEKAAIYVVDSHEDLSGWFGKGLFGDLTGNFGLASDIPSGLNFNNTGLGSYGIPLMLEGYGYIVDKTMLSDLFGGASTEAMIRDLAACSYTDFEGFIEAVATYISAPSAATVTLNGNEYTFAAEKTGKAQSLTGVFSLNYDSADASRYLLNYALASKFGTNYEIMNANESAVNGLKDIFSAYIDALDMHTSHIAGSEGMIGRGDEFIGGDYDYSASVDAFTGGYALFYPGSTGDAADFETSSAGFSSNLDIIPMKLPITDKDISAAGMTAEKLQSSIVIGSRYYIALNPNAEEAYSTAAKDFVNWLYSDEAGMKAYTSAFGGLPFNYSYGETEGAGGSEGTGSATGGTSTSESNESTTSEGSTSGKSAARSSAGTSASGSSDSGTLSSGTADGSAANSGTTDGSQSGSSGSNSTNTDSAAAGEEENPTEDLPPRVPNYNITDSLTAAVARYYAEGNWIPAMTGALPGDWLENVFGSGLTDYWGMETWGTEDRTGLVDKFIGGWNDRINKTGNESNNESSNVG